MKKGKIKFTFNMALFLIWVVIFGAISLNAPAFLKPNYIINVMLRNIVEIGMVALPMTMIIITGGIDLSVGNILVLSAMLGGMAAASFGTAMGIVVTLLTGAICGLINGLIIARAKISPMVTTLATMYLYLGLARGISKGDSVYAYDFAENMGTMSIVGIPVQIWIYSVIAILFIILLGKTTFGRKLYSIGLNKNATKYAGVDTEKMLIVLYTLCGIICALAAFIWLGRFTSVKYDAGTSFNLKVITAVVLGGTSINGGFGDMKGTVLATLIIATLNSGLTVLNIPIDVQTIVQGVVLMIALISYAVVNVRMKKKKIVAIDKTNVASEA
ncbi:ribose ABC transporter permease [Sporanaerobium hydrogeniformans]|uniref:Ribose ABC transporter permease n=1 Tax=Sporanaerobium hydrogeniformans TaxID=3072179 RepID=A0AC61DAL8_9FIRM|nr:ABC transporter permease [Sporanaerobium hydrogeniformans]PHV70304.1 ribose ABC transporter permease [Sporanaerobium hydrogeniformans]